eukprot:scaffold1778_cov13-Tisochrysis_lutea.AAC.1
MLAKQCLPVSGPTATSQPIFTPASHTHPPPQKAAHILPRRQHRTRVLASSSTVGAPFCLMEHGTGTSHASHLDDGSGNKMRCTGRKEALTQPLGKLRWWAWVAATLITWHLWQSSQSRMTSSEQRSSRFNVPEDLSMAWTRGMQANSKTKDKSQIRPLLDGVSQVQGGGNAANALTAAARLGLGSTLVTKVGCRALQ